MGRYGYSAAALPPSLLPPWGPEYLGPSVPYGPGAPDEVGFLRDDQDPLVMERPNLSPLAEPGTYAPYPAAEGAWVASDGCRFPIDAGDCCDPRLSPGQGQIWGLPDAAMPVPQPSPANPSPLPTTPVPGEDPNRIRVPDLPRDDFGPRPGEAPRTRPSRTPSPEPDAGAPRVNKPATPVPTDVELGPTEKLPESDPAVLEPKPEKSNDSEIPVTPRSRSATPGASPDAGVLETPELSIPGAGSLKPVSSRFQPVPSAARLWATQLPPVRR